MIVVVLDAGSRAAIFELEYRSESAQAKIKMITLETLSERDHNLSNHMCVIFILFYLTYTGESFGYIHRIY